MTRTDLLKIAKPILFNTEMVKAIIEGKKTVTRRVVNPSNKRYFIDKTLSGKPAEFQMISIDEAKFIRMAKPQYKVNDILYVRETWSFQSCDICGGKCDTTPPDCFKGEPGCYVYRTNYGTTDDDTFPPSMFTWRPSIHMPKEAARIFLKVTDVRVERLQDITAEQIDTEGCKEYGYNAKTGKLMPSRPTWFKIIWDNTIKKQDLDKYGWNANPWVWVYEFERVECDEVN